MTTGAALDPALLEPALLEPALLDPALLDPAAEEPAAALEVAEDAAVLLLLHAATLTTKEAATQPAVHLRMRI